MKKSCYRRTEKLGFFGLLCVFSLMFQSHLVWGKGSSADSGRKSTSGESVFSRTHQTKSLFAVSPVNFDYFSSGPGVDFSLMKYGSQEHIEKFADKLVSLIYRDHGEDLSSHPDDWVIVSPAYLRLPTSAALLTESVGNRFKARFGVTLKNVSLKRRTTNSIDFGSLQNISQRESHIKGNFYYEGPDLKGKKLLFIEDALVSGTHYIESQRALTQVAGVSHEHIFGYFLVNVEQAGAENPDFSLEAAINHMYIPKDNPEILKNLMLNKSNKVTPRVLKYIFSSSDFTGYFCEQLPYRPLSKIYAASLLDGFDQLEPFRGMVARIKSCTEEKLRELKQEEAVHSLVQVNEKNFAALHEKNISHDKFSGPVSLSSCIPC